MSEIKLHPQPLGVFAGPPGGLLLPSLDSLPQFRQEGQLILSALLKGQIDDNMSSFPEPWLFYREAATGNIDNALAALNEQQAWAEASEQGWLFEFNRFVLQGNSEIYQSLHRQLGDSNSESSALLEATAYLHGLKDELTYDPEQIQAPEVQAYLQSTRAHQHLSRQQMPEGLEKLREAAQKVESISPIFAARLHGECGTAGGEQPQYNDLAIEHYQKALALLEAATLAGLKALRAELALELGMCCQMFSEGRRDKLLASIYAYQQALLYFHREGPQPYNYGLAHMNLALVYLSMPMNDEAERLRPAIAVQSLREALKIFTRESNTRMWASATLNLANALQHVPSTHNEANLWEAVQLYQDILEVRKESDDPLAYGRVLANQGNALAHLGAFSRAEPTLRRALAIFTEQKDENASTIEEMLQEIAARRSEVGNI